MTRSLDRTKTLDELEAVRWGEAPVDSYLLSTIHRLRKKPIGEFSVEDLRLMIGQGLGLRFLVPLALEAVERNPLAEGDYYPGDLLANLLRVDPGFWTTEWEWRDRLGSVIDGLTDVPKELIEPVAAFRLSTA
jgi:CDI immunity proteins